MQSTITTTLTLDNGTTLSLDLHCDNRVTMWRVEGANRVWSGDGHWTGEVLTCCEADFSEDDYDQINDALFELDLSGV